MSQPPAHNPILRAEPVQLFGARMKRPTPKAHTTVVYLGARNQLFHPEGPLTWSGLAFRNLQRLYEIDLSEHTAEVASWVPCRERGYYFDATVRLRWKVVHPDRIVRDGRRDVTPLYEDHVADVLRRHSERFSFEERLRAQQTMQCALDAEKDLDEGIRITRYFLELHLQEELEEHVAPMLTALAGRPRPSWSRASRTSDAPAAPPTRLRSAATG
jgi:hypothetical protein